MPSAPLPDDLVKEACDLLRRSAHPRRKTLRVSPEVAAALESLSRPRAPQQPAPPSSSGIPTAPTAEPSPALADLARAVSTCTRCALSQGRNHTVFGDGDPNADLVFVGEAPGADEDRSGLPFVGRAGQLLTDIIEKGMKLRRGDVYICNVLKCRPPGNRDPRPDEVEQCEPYLVEQLSHIRPKVICALGAHAARTLLKTKESTGRLRGKWHFYHGIPLRVTYHPAYLLRSPGEKRKTWEDIQEVMKVLSGEVTPEPPPAEPQEQDLFS